MHLAIREAECSQRRGGCLCPCGVGAAVLSYSVFVLLWKEGEVKQNNPITAECLITSGARRKGEKRRTHPWRQLDARYLFIVVFSSATLIWTGWRGLALRGGGTKMKLQAPQETLQCREMQLLWGERCSQTINSQHLSSLSVSFASSPPRFGPRLFRIVTPAWLLTHAAN